MEGTEFEYYLKSATNDADMAKGGSPLTTITNPIVTTTVEAESWYTLDSQHALIVSAPAGFVGGSRPKNHS